MANDLVGWILLGVIAGLVSSGELDVAGLALTLAAFAAFGAFALTVGQRLVDAALRRARAAREPLPRAVTVLVVVMLGAGAITQAIGVEAVLGAFVTGILVGRSRYQPVQLGRTIDVIANAFFAPVFFATAGLFVDLGALFDPVVALWTLVLILVAGLAKLGGASLGGALGGMHRLEALAVGVGLNARGALEIVVATVGLGLGVLNQTSYTAVVVMAMVTSMVAPPLLRRVLTWVGPAPDEASRLEREETLDRSVIAGTRHALVPTRGGLNSLHAARLLDLCLPPDAAVTVYAVHGDHELHGVVPTDDVRRAFRRHTSARVDRSSSDPAAAICAEARLGYGLVALGMSEQTSPMSPMNGNGSAHLSATLRTLLGSCPVPMLLFRHAHGADGTAEPRIRRILVPAVGTRVAQAAQEIAYLLADRVDAEIDALHVVNRPDTHDVWATDGSAFAAVSAVLDEARTLANRYGREASTVARSGSSVGQEIVASAEERGSDLIVVGTQVRVSGGQPFLGHGVEYLVKHAPQTLLLVVFPTADAVAAAH
jgi:nucleotide-binding universal stress UspA family protein